jgi:glycine/D-amino acid oxidase-like deaminating enzyme
MPNIPVWEDGSWVRLPQLQGSQQCDVCVVGLGGAGLSCAVQLRQHGLRVIGIDAGMIAGAAAGRNGGFLLAGLADFYHDAVAAIGREHAAWAYRLTLAELKQTAMRHPDAVRVVGSLRIAHDDAEYADCQAQYAAMIADDLPVYHYTGHEGRGLLFPSDASFNPLQRCRDLAHQARALGALLYEDTPAIALQPGLVQTSQGQITCQQIVVAVDGGLEQILPELRGQIRSARLQMLATEPTDELLLTRPVYYRWGYEYWQQLPDRRIAFGGFRDQGGDAEWGAAAEPAEPIQSLMSTFLRERLGVHAPITHCWAAQVAFSDSLFPYVGEVRSNLWALGAYNGTGNLWSTIGGRALADQITTGHSAIIARIQQLNTA